MTSPETRKTAAPALDVSATGAAVWLSATAFLALLVLYFIASGLMGLVIPTTSVLALEEHGAHAGAASALLGVVTATFGGVLRDIEATHGALRLNELMRFRTPGEGSASLAMRGAAAGVCRTGTENSPRPRAPRTHHDREPPARPPLS